MQSEFPLEWFIYFPPTLFCKCSYLVDYGTRQLFPSICIAWCHGHFVSSILVVAQLWRKFCQTLGHSEDLILWIESDGLWWVQQGGSSTVELSSTWFWTRNVQVVLRSNSRAAMEQPFVLNPLTQIWRIVDASQVLTHFPLNISSWQRWQ